MTVGFLIKLVDCLNAPWEKGKGKREKRTGNFGIDNGEQRLPSITGEKLFRRVSVIWVRMGSSSSTKDFLLLLQGKKKKKKKKRKEERLY